MKRGFTLVELLVIIAIIGLLVVIAVPSGIAISKKIKQKMLDTKIELIENAGVSWGQKNESKITEGTDSCQIDEIKNDTEVTHCIRKEISFLIDNRELEADDEKDGVKFLKNPVNDESLNNCSVEIYIKNKRVYAKLDINNEGICGYIESEIVEDYIPIISLNNDTEEYNKYTLPNSNDILDIYKSDNNIINKIKNGEYMTWVDPGKNLINAKGEIINTVDDDWEVSKSWNENDREWTYTYSIKLNGPSDIKYKDKIESVNRVLKLVDEYSPILVDENYEEYESDKEIKFKVCNGENDPLLKLNVFDNYDGITSFKYSSLNLSDTIASVTLTDTKNNKKYYEWSISILKNDPPVVSYVGDFKLWDIGSIGDLNDYIEDHVNCKDDYDDCEISIQSRCTTNIYSGTDLTDGICEDIRECSEIIYENSYNACEVDIIADDGCNPVKNTEIIVEIENH